MHTQNSILKFLIILKSVYYKSVASALIYIKMSAVRFRHIVLI